MVMTQKTQRHPSASVRYPPAMGPMMGPSNGPMDQMAMAPPLCSGGSMSEMVPLPHVTTDTPASPAKKRKTMSMPMFCETAQQTVKMVKKTLHTW